MRLRQVMFCLLGFVLFVAASATVGIAQKDKQPKIDGETLIKNIRTDDAFRYFSGNSGSVHNHPVMYARADGMQKLIVVVGKDCHEEFPISQINDAVARYKKLLDDQKYLKK